MDDKLLEDIRDIKIVDYLESCSVHLKYNGSSPEVRFRCYAHQPDNTPSCDFNLDKNTWTCRACPENGDLIKLVQFKEGVDFKGSVKHLSEWLGRGIITQRSNGPPKVESNVEYLKVKSLPIPEGLPPKADEPIETFSPNSGKVKTQRPLAVYPYYDLNKKIIHYTIRIKTPKGKIVLPMYWGQAGNFTGWILQKNPDHNLLYGLQRFNRDDNKQVLIVEGEKCVDWFYSQFPELANKYVCVSWLGGANAVKKADWRVLAPSNFILWADGDNKGIKAMDDLIELVSPLVANGIKSVKVESMEEKEDIADLTDIAIVTDHLEGAKVIKKPQEEWMEQLIRTKRKIVKERSIRNVSLYLENHSLVAGMIKFDETYSKVILQFNPGFLNDYDDKPFPRAMDDCDITSIIEWLETEDLMPSRTTVKGAIVKLSGQNKYDSLKEWLTNLGPTWDKKPRIDTFFIDHCGVKDTPYTRMVSRLLFMALVSRRIDPGGKQDYYFILEGEGGMYKSEFLKVLATPRHHKDGLPDFRGEAFFYHISGCWIVEDDEMNLHNMADVGRNKGFISKTTDEQRKVYDSDTTEVKRRFVIVATTNHVEEKYLEDHTGNRRYIILHVSQDGIPIDIKAVAKWREQAFAEAVQAYEANPNWWLNRQQEALAAQYQLVRTSENVYVQPLLQALEESAQGPVHEFDFIRKCRDGITKKDCWKHVLGTDYSTRNGKLYEEAMRACDFVSIGRPRDPRTGTRRSEQWKLTV